jgi:peptide chain release factor 1
MITPEKLQGIIDKFESIEQRLGDPEVIRDAQKLQDLSREHSRLREIVEVAREYQRVHDEHAQALELVESSDDAEMRQLARHEAASLRHLEGELAAKLEIILVPPDPLDEKSTIVEVRAGTGGDEAALFAADLARMYQRYAERRSWKMEVLSSSPTGIGGFKEIIFSVSVPETEGSGRIHTSTATVAVLPEVEAVDVQINPGDLEIETTRSGGPGGQHVNTSDSAVRIVHRPTGIEVRCQDERSQLKNKDKAMKILRSRLYERQRAEQQEKRADERRSQIGSGERSEKIRTYNFPQSRLTDHRVGLTVHNLSEILDGDIDDVVQALVTEHQRAQLASR